MQATVGKQAKNNSPADKGNLSGVQKAAILLISLGVEKASRILKEMKEPEVEKITIAIADMQDIDFKKVKAVREEYYDLLKAQEDLVEGGSDYAHALLAKSVGKKKADELMEKHQVENSTDAFSLFQQAEISKVVRFLGNESPQVAAVVLAHLKTEKAAEILSALPDKFQASTAYRLANMRNVSSDVVEELESMVKDKLGSNYGEIKNLLKGVTAIANILNEANIATERKVIEGISEVDSELAEEIKQQMFLFEDILNIEDLTLQKIIVKLDRKDTVMALKGQDEKLKQKFVTNMSQQAGEILLDDLAAVGPVHVSQVEEAQSKIIRTIQELDEDGQITLRKNRSENIIE